MSTGTLIRHSRAASNKTPRGIKLSSSSARDVKPWTCAEQHPEIASEVTRNISPPRSSRACPMSVDRGRSEDSYDGGLKTAINERFFNEALDQLVVFNNEDNN